MKADGSLSY